MAGCLLLAHRVISLRRKICPLLDQSRQSSALARDASVATIEFFWK
jgi:hypothetical protein